MSVSEELFSKTGFLPKWKPVPDDQEPILNDAKGRPILVVEDNVDDSFLLTRQLARADMDDCVTVLGNGTDAFAWLMASPQLPIAMFVDLSLPGMSGIKIIRKIKAQPSLQTVPIIVMTGSLNPRDVDTCTALGVTAYLPKPVGLATFIKIVSHLFPKKV